MCMYVWLTGLVMMAFSELYDSNASINVKLKGTPCRQTWELQMQDNFDCHNPHTPPRLLHC